ncbi:MAG: sigma-54-dependent Fis family transcriptional regulator, partial [Ignavibacteriales bacterium]
MGTLITRDKRLEKIWLDFINGGSEQNTILRQVIYDSWIRCRQYGIDPYLGRVPQALNSVELDEELKRKDDLLQVAVPVIEDLFSVVDGSGFGVWITNESGVILKGIANKDDQELLEEYGMVEGSDFSEEAMGTNAIGTSIKLRQPVPVVWMEHYCQIAHITACSAAPIMSPEGEIVGVISMTGYQERAHPHTLGIVVAGARAIEREMRLQKMHQKIQLSHQYVLEMMESLPSGIIVVSQEGIITNLNRKACEMLKSPAENLLNQNIFDKCGKLECIERVLKYGKIQEDVEQHFNLERQRLHFVLSSRPIINSKGILDGAVIVLREIEAVMRITSKMAGYSARFNFENIIGKSPALMTAIKQAKSAAATSSIILMLGESGTGKEMFAQSIHNASHRRYGPFVAINCGALPRELIGSELFGYEEGAFTGAKRGGSPGKFELANNGTLFLDEIGDMPLDLQLALLRVLQDGIVVRLGGYQQISVNVRLIAATNKDLPRMVKDGLFRQDLYYRLNVITIKLPPLRDRPGDSAILANHFLRLQSEKIGKTPVSLSPLAITSLERYNWPGNVRELENVLERALVFSNGSEISESVLIPDMERKLSNESPVRESESRLSIKSGEKSLIMDTLERCQGNISQTAISLGITRATLYRKLRSYGIIQPSP